MFESRFRSGDVSRDAVGVQLVDLDGSGEWQGVPQFAGYASEHLGVVPGQPGSQNELSFNQSPEGGVQGVPIDLPVVDHEHVSTHGSEDVED